MSNRAAELVLDVSAEDARALHRIVRAVHDGHCPACGYLGPAEMFTKCNCLRNRIGTIHWPSCPMYDMRHECPQCHFTISADEAKAALRAFNPHLQKSLAVFEQWRGQPSAEECEQAGMAGLAQLMGADASAEISSNPAK